MAVLPVKYQPIAPKRPPPPLDKKRLAALKVKAQELLATKAKRRQLEPIPTGLSFEEGARRAEAQDVYLREQAKVRQRKEMAIRPPEGGIGGMATGLETVLPFLKGAGKQFAAATLMPPPQLEFLAPFSRERRAGWAEALAPRTEEEAYGGMVGRLGPRLGAFGMEPLTPEELAHPLTAGAFAFPPGLVATKGLQAMRAGLGEPSVMGSLRGIAPTVKGAARAPGAFVEKMIAGQPRIVPETRVMPRVPKKPALPAPAVAPAAREPWQMTKQEFGEVTQFPTGGRFNITGKAQEVRIAEEGQSKFFTSPQSAQKWIDTKHRSLIRQALSAGKPIPAEVLKDYPDLARLTPAAPAKAAAPPVAEVAEESAIAAHARRRRELRAAPPTEVVAPRAAEAPPAVRPAPPTPAAEAVTPPPPVKPPVAKGPPPEGPVSQKPPASPAPLPVPTGGPGQGIQEAIQAAKGKVEMTRPGLITRILDYIPGIRQAMREVHPRLKMSDEMLTGWVAEGGAEATVSNSLQVERFTASKQLEASFGKPQVLAGETKTSLRFLGTPEQAKYPFTNTLRDVVEYPELYNLTPTQRALIDSIGTQRDQTFGGLRSSYNLKVGQFPRRPGSIFLSNYDVSESALEFYGSAERAGMVGRARERFYEGARERWAHTKSFKPDTNVYRLFESMDEGAAKMAGRQTFVEAVGGKTKLQAMEELHPKLATALTAVRNRVNKIKSYQSSLRQQTQDTIDDFLASGMEDADLAALQAELSEGLKPGRFVAKAQAGKQMADLRKEWVAARGELASLQRGWRVADLRPYQRVQDAGNLLFKAEDAQELSRLLKTSSNRVLRFVDDLRATAFGGDLSPISIQGLTVWLSDPVGVSRAVAGATAKGVLPSFTEEGLVAFARANPERTSRFVQSTGIRFLGGVTPEFAVGFPGKIPKVGKFWTEFNETLYRPLVRHMEAIFHASYEGALKRGLTEVQAMAVGAKDASRIIPRIDYRLLGQSQAEAARYRAALTSVSFLVQPTALVADATKGIVKMGLLRPLSQNEKFAVRRVLTLFATAESLAVASHVAYAKSKGQDMWEAALDSLNPESGFFMSLVLPNGWKIGMGGPFRSLFKAIAPSRIEGVSVPVPFAGMYRWGMSKMGPAPRIAYDEIRNQDFYGRKIRTGDFPINILQGIAYAFEGSLPLTIGETARGLRTGELLGGIARETLGQFGGVNISPVVTISEFRRKWRGDIQPYFDIPSEKEVRIMKEEILGKGLSKADENAQLDALAEKYPFTPDEYREDNPEVDARLFILGEVSSLKPGEAFDIVVRLLKENNLTVKDIMPPEKGESDAKKELRSDLEEAFGVPPEKPPVNVIPTVPNPALQRAREKLRLVPAGAR